LGAAADGDAEVSGSLLPHAEANGPSAARAPAALGRGGSLQHAAARDALAAGDLSKLPEIE
jgi:hypothetical protein